MNIVDKMHFTIGLDPVADAFTGTGYSDGGNCQGEGILFIRQDGVGTTGTSTITVEACDDVTPTNSTAVEFTYRIMPTNDTWGDWTDGATTGFTTTAGSSQLYQVYVAGAQLAEQGYGYARLKLVEVADDPVLGGLLCIVCNLRYGEQPSTLIT